jgi:hypothetical protein
MKRLIPLALAAVWLSAYPLDSDKRTGIRRLTGYRLAQSGQVKGPKVPPGGLWTTDRIQLRLLSNRALDIGPSTAKDPALQRGLEEILGGRNLSYAMALLDITDPQRPRYAAVREDELLLPGSVGKLLVATGMMDALKRAYPDIAAREKVLRETVRAADGFVIRDGKTVPFYEPGSPAVVNRQIAPGDKFSLWEWLDHMLSQSSNAAGSFSWKEAVLLRRFGTRYPIPPAEEKSYLSSTPKPELGKAALETLEDPLRDAGIDTGRLRLGTMFTSGGSKVFPGAKSYGTPRELLKWLVRMEQGRLVDEWSSLELKRLIYFARPRYRYSSAPSLNNAAVFFKSGSFFQCRPEPGFTCKPYAGNETNIMNSVAAVESGGRVYLATLMSNVLRINSAVEHQRIAGLVEKLIQSSVSGR